MSATMLTSDIRNILEGFEGLDRLDTISRVGVVEEGSAIITTIDCSGLKPYMKIAGEGIPVGAIISEVMASSIQISAPVSGVRTGATIDLTITTYSQISDAFLVSVRDRKIIPYVEEKVGFSLTGTPQKITEYRSGTGSSIIILSRRPVISVQSINLVTNPSNWIYVSPTSVEVIADEGILKLRTVLEAWTSYVPAFPRGKDNIKVEYTYGFEGVPDDLCDAVNSLVASFTLGHVGSRTGGGNLNTQGITRAYGERGKWEQHRRELERYAYATIRRYMTGVTG